MRFGRQRKQEVQPETADVDDPMTSAVRIIRPDADPQPAQPDDAAGNDDAQTAPVASGPGITTSDRVENGRARTDESKTAETEPVQLDGRTDRVDTVRDERPQSSPNHGLDDSPSARAAPTPDREAGGDRRPDEPTRGGDPLLHRSSTADDAAERESVAVETTGMGRSGVRIIPSATAVELDPTAPFVGDDVDGASAGDGGRHGVGAVTVRSAGDPTELDGERPTIVINDDGASTVAPETGSARSRIDPKFRARRRAVRRSMGRRRMALLGLGTTVIIVAVIIGALLGSPLFALRLDKVEVTGWEYADQGEMYAIFDDLAGTPVLRIDEDAVEAQLEAVAWVEQAVVDTNLPNSATIQIRERTPLATFQGADGRFRIIDRYGRVLEIVDGMPIEYMWITVSDPPNLERGEFAATGVAAAAETTRSLTPSIRSRLRRIAVDQSGTTMALYLRDGTRVNLGAARDIFSKLVRLQTLLDDFPGMTNVRIDVSTAETTRSSASQLELTDGATEAPADVEPVEGTGDGTADGAAAEEVTSDTSPPTDPAGSDGN